MVDLFDKKVPNVRVKVVKKRKIWCFHVIDSILTFAVCVRLCENFLELFQIE